MRRSIRVVLVFVCYLISSSYVYADLAITNYYNQNGQIDTSHFSNRQVVNYFYDKNGNLTSKLLNVNLVNNPSFENIKDNSIIADGWSTWSDIKSQDKFEVVTTPVSSGRQAQKISSTGMPTGSGIWALQDVVVEENKAYVLSGQFYVEAQKNSQVQLLIQFFDASNNFLGSSVASMPSGIYQSYMTLPVTGKIPTSATRARIHAGLKATGTGGSGSFIVDSLSFRYEPDGNRLTNGGMDSSTAQKIADGWSTWSDTKSQDKFEVVTTPVSSGRQAQKISSTGMPT
ncbi:hypothetical protein, partial [Paenibacillus pseudetheri]|uniref:hypothetical protein n=1 Tax=Paenibacillus pseudetheri TaxID=2897682 RepID=UPI001F2F14C4